MLCSVTGRTDFRLACGAPKWDVAVLGPGAVVATMTDDEKQIHQVGRFHHMMFAPMVDDKKLRHNINEQMLSAPGSTFHVSIQRRTMVLILLNNDEFTPLAGYL